MAKSHPRRLLDRWRETTSAADPGRVRLRLALRAVLSAAVAAALLAPLAKAAGQPTAANLIGIFVAIMSSLLVTDATSGRQLATRALLPVGAAVAVAAAALAGQVPGLADGLFLGFVFLAVALRRFGARWGAVGMLSFLAYYLSLYLKISPQRLPWTLACLVIGALVAALVRYAVVRDRPQRILRQLADGYRARLAGLLDRLARTARRGAWRQEGRIRADGERLSEAGLLLQDHLVTDEAAPLRRATFESGLAAERVVWAVGRLLAAPVVHPETSAAAAQLLERAADDVRAKRRVEASLPASAAVQGATSRRDATQEATSARDALPRSSSSPDPALTPVANSLRDLLATLPPGAALAALPPQPSITGLAGAGGPAPVALRQAVQATVACGLAMLVGRHVSATRWQWAVLAAFVIFSRTTTVSDTLVRAWERTLGTLLGAAAGFAVAELLRGDARVELALIFACLFVAYYTMRTAYAVMVGAVTTMLALVYDLMGIFTPGLMMVRLEETLLGAALGAAAAVLILPTPAGRVVREKVAATLQACADLVAARLAARDAVVDDQEAVRALQRRLQEARASARPLTGGILAPLQPELPVAFYRLAGLVFYATQLATDSSSGGCPSPLPPAERARAEHLVAELRELAKGVTEPQPRVLWSRRRLLPKRRPPAATQCLGRMEQLVDDLRRTLRPSPARPRLFSHSLLLRKEAPR